MNHSIWDERYAVDEYVYGTEVNDFLKQVQAQLPSGAALCLGAGEGRNATFLAEQGRFSPVFAVDQSPVGLDKARRLAVQRGVSIETVADDLQHFDLGKRRWDVITSIFAHTEPTLRRKIHRSVVAALKPQGCFVLEAYTPAQIGRGTGGPPDPHMMMTLKDLSRELEGLHFELAEEIERDVTEGRLHSGRAHVVRVLARKTKS